MTMLTLDQRYPFRGYEIAWGSLGSGPPLVLVHGFPWSSQCWRKLAPWLAKSHQTSIKARSLHGFHQRLKVPSLRAHSYQVPEKYGPRTERLENLILIPEGPLKVLDHKHQRQASS